MEKEKLMNKYLNEKELPEKLKEKVKQMFEKSNIGKKRVYGLRDVNAGFTQVFIETNDAIVYRNVYQAIKTAKELKQPTPLSDFPDNFSIYLVAEIDEENNVVNSVLTKLIEIEDLIQLYS